MTIDSFLEALKVVIRHVLELVGNAFLAYSIFWGILEPALSLHLNDSFDPYKATLWKIIILSSVVCGVLRMLWGLIWPRIHVPAVNFSYENNDITITYGNLFKKEGFKVIPVSRFMKEIDVDKGSLQDQMINKVIVQASKKNKTQSDIQLYKERLNKATFSKSPEQPPENKRSLTEEYYPLGTLASLAAPDQDYLLLALTETELTGADRTNNCNIDNLWLALRDMWQSTPGYVKNQSINIPLLGSGASGIKLSPQQLLELNIIALMNAITKSDSKITTKKIRIILHRGSHWGKINLKDLNLPSKN